MTTAKPMTIRLNAADNVTVARVDLLPGTEVEGIACLEIFGEKAEPLRSIGRFFIQRAF